MKYNAMAQSAAIYARLIRFDKTLSPQIWQGQGGCRRRQQ
ncbi:hypothetical protein DWUX_1852 [Desulfovibrio diazotrophicus]|nr:hypothetical protein DWUX_1852 [Desulfovibrio diazotrophicus]